jgi:hypothetical protein
VARQSVGRAVACVPSAVMAGPRPGLTSLSR